ncbi:tRNA(Phe) 7-((3-amino-3-carboxypropyl)-4-demethylwyosine(37)-N(4))-methyltransferase [Methanopyrus sp.]
MHWEGEKRRRLKELERAIGRGEVDEAVIPVLKALNSFEEYCTTSSCSGRVVVLHEPKIGDKVGSEFVAKWHEPPEPEEVREAVLKAPEEGITWVKAQPPLFHVMCRDLKAAVRLRNIASEAGFKASSIRSIKSSKVIVEILGGERMDVPAKVDGKLTLREEAWDSIVTLCNDILRSGHERLSRLVEALEGLSR